MLSKTLKININV